MKTKIKKKQLLLVLLMLICSTTYSLAQVAVSGLVKDELGEPVIGAAVQVKGTTVGTITGLDGNFQLFVDDVKKSVLVVSFLGYDSKEIVLNGRTNVEVVLSESSTQLEEVTIVAYGVQKKETLTGAIASLKTEDLIQSPNSSVANSLAGKVTGLSSVQVSGEPGAEDPKLFVRGIGSMTEGGATPLMLVDGVERSFFQMDPNEIESITVLKDASATAVFGVRGANGVILVTTKRGEEGKTKISVNSSVGLQTPTRMLDMVDSYTYATMYNELQRNDGRIAKDQLFDDYTLKRFELGDSPILFPDIKWRDYMMNNVAMQTQHNLNISGGTKNVRYFISLGYLFQDGLFKDFGQDNLGYDYSRYNYRANLDLNITKSTILKLGLGGIVGDKMEPINNLWKSINWSQPFSGAGLVEGNPVVTAGRFPSSIKMEEPFTRYYGKGYSKKISNTMNMDIHLIQKLDFLTRGLSFEVKGAYNTNYSFVKKCEMESEIYTAYAQSELENPEISFDDPNFNNDIIYRISNVNSKKYNKSSTRGRDWYFEASLRYNRKFGSHNIGALLLYNQNKKYYPKEYSFLPTAYVGFVGRVTYDYMSRYMAEFNVGYNGSENFAPDKRFGTFPAFSIGYILTEEGFMKNQKIFDFLKLRASVGLVGNDNMSGYRYLYLPDAYLVDQRGKEDGSWKTYPYGYNFGLNSTAVIKGAFESRLANTDVTWETALKQNYGVDMNFLDNRLKVKCDYFMEHRKDILINRQTFPNLTGLTSSLLPVVNLGKVENKGYEVEIGWSDMINENFNYYINANMSYAKNIRTFMDEVEPNEPYMRRTGTPVGTVFGYVADGFYSENDFVKDDEGNLTTELVKGLPRSQYTVYPGDVRYKDLNEDGFITTDDVKDIGYSDKPNYIFGLNYGASYKGFFFSMNWTGAAERSLLLSQMFRRPFNGESRALMQYQVDNRWTPETAETATQPRFSFNSDKNNYGENSTLWVMDGSYLKLKNFTIGYNFTNKSLLKKIGINQLGVKFTGYNLLTFDKFGIMDPESNPNEYGDTYPVVKIYNIGVNVTF